MSTNQIITTAIAVIIVAGLVTFAIVRSQNSDTDPISEITSFAECVAAGNPVMESYPRQCAADGKTFTEDVGNSVQKMDLIQVESPRPNEEVSSPLTLEGRARGNWFFEATAPVTLYDRTGARVAQGYIQADGEWMTTEFVDFSGTLTWTGTPAQGTGKIVFEKSNASGLPEHADEMHFPVEL